MCILEGNKVFKLECVLFAVLAPSTSAPIALRSHLRWSGVVPYMIDPVGDRASSALELSHTSKQRVSVLGNVVDPPWRR